MAITKKELITLLREDARYQRSEFPEIGIVHHGSQGGKIACIGQLVQADDPVIRIFLQHMEHKVTTNKTSAAGNNNIHDLFSSIFIFWFFY